MKLLVANRGEIAVRVLRAARELGAPTVAVYSDADRDALHVRLADEAVHLGPTPPAESYLNAGRLLAAAAATGATHLHPGYGFLSENADFARAVLAAGLCWVGPSPAAIATMGDKAAARRAMAAVGVPVVPGTESPDVATLTAMGFPLVVKAVAGGGGRGMRVVREASGLEEALAGAAREALAAFGDGRLYAESLIEPARHIEVQVLGDQSGQVIALGARECSVQRRSQKLLEESPAPGLDTAALAAMEAAAVRGARSVGYVGAGTVEFLLAPTGAFYFLEMNTRIQVEHGVTELVTGIDLVAAQLRIAEGARVPEPPIARGHAIEARICAEDVAGGFLPSPGQLLRFRLPAGPGVRVDSGFEEGDPVPDAYDSLLCKVLVHAEDRNAAIARLSRALSELDIAGVPTTAPLLARVLASGEFAAGTIHTRWLEPFAAGLQPNPDAVEAIAAGWAFANAGGAGTPSCAAMATATPWQSLGSWR
ncbi:hypothetical protein LBMAG42_51520 [Deltaproteobacteria bacterium]|nr:hypothetical protein LBMAG42_51520 [Deltaproteobacteria bacterium]